MPIPPGRLALTNLFIALGSLILGTGGTFFGTGDQMVDFGIWLAVGVTVLFVGFLFSNPGGPAAAASPTSPYWAELYQLATAPAEDPSDADDRAA